MTFLKPNEALRSLGRIEGFSVGDFGSGVGYYSLLLAESVAPWGRVYAIDIQQDLIEALYNKAREEKKEDRLRIIWGDIDEEKGTGLPDATLDAGVLINTLFMLEKKEKAATEIGRVLKKGAKLLVIDWADSFGGAGPKKESLISKEEAKHIFEEAGFFYEKDISAGAHHWGMLVRKT